MPIDDCLHRDIFGDPPISASRKVIGWIDLLVACELVHNLEGAVGLNMMLRYPRARSSRLRSAWRCRPQILQIHWHKSTSLQRTTPSIAGIGPLSITAFSAARWMWFSFGGWPGALRSITVACSCGVRYRGLSADPVKPLLSQCVGALEATVARVSVAGRSAALL